jgi:hypothetical protein
MKSFLQEKWAVLSLMLIVGGLLSAFVVAPMTAQKSIEKEYAFYLVRWQELERSTEKNVFSWFRPEDTEKVKKDFESFRKKVQNTQEIYQKCKQSYSLNDLSTAYRAVKDCKIAEIFFYNRHQDVLQMKENSFNKVKEYNTRLAPYDEFLSKLSKNIEQANFPEKYKKILQDTISVVTSYQQQVQKNIAYIKESHTPAYEGKSKVNIEMLKLYMTETPMYIEKTSKAYIKANEMFVGFINAPSSVANEISNYQVSVQKIYAEIHNNSQPKILTASYAMKKTDSLARISQSQLSLASSEVQKQDFIGAYLQLEKTKPIVYLLEQEYQYQKVSYNNFIKNYANVTTELQEATTASGLSASDKNSVDRISKEALVAQQMAMQYAMAGNWLYAQNQLKTSSNKSSEAYRIAFKRSSSYSSNSGSSYSSSKSNSGSSYSSSKSNSGSSYSSSKSNSGSSSSYSSSSKKSDSRSWSSSSSSSSKKSSSSSSGSRRSDSRSWGSSRKK